MHSDIVRAEEDLKAAERVHRATVARVQAQCSHHTLGECEYQEMHFGDHMPPVRVCMDCGMTEVGWGCGYQVLVGPSLMISRSKVHALRRGLRVSRSDQGPLIRNEVTVQDLILKRV